MAVSETQSTCTLMKLTHKKQRALLKKQHRKLKRQSLARAREKDKKEEDASTPEDVEREQIQREEMERQYLHYQWLRREAAAQNEFIKKKEQQERELLEKQKIQKQLEEELSRIEEEKSKENYEKDKIAGEKKAREEAILSQTEKNKDGPWHNPIAPSSSVPVTTNERGFCNFYMKTGACRFGDRCSRSHHHPSVSKTLLIPGMYSHFMIDQSFHDEYDTDLGLEYEDSETYQHFRDFYDDVLPEFKALGRVIQFKVCCNFEPHLRGNVYVQYETENEAVAAFQKFNGRWYGGRQLSCEFTTVTKWKSAICGVFQTNRCPKGKGCNFLHVFRNPTREFLSADHDRIDTRNGGPNDRRNTEGSLSRGQRDSRSGRHSERYYSRHRSKSRSRSPSRTSSRRHRLSPLHSQTRRRNRRSRSSSDSSPNYRSSSKRSRNRSGSRSRRNLRIRSRQRSRSRSRQRSTSKSRQKRLQSRSNSRSPVKDNTSNDKLLKKDKNRTKSIKKKSSLKQRTSESPDWSSVVEVSKPGSPGCAHSSSPTKRSDTVSPRIMSSVNASTG